MRISFFVFIALFLCHPSFSQGTDLSLRLEKGKVYRQNTNSKVNIVQNLNGGEMKITMTVKGTMLFMVTDIKGDNYVMDASFEKLGMVMEMPQGTMEFNSEKSDENDVFSSMLSAMKGKPFGVLMNKTGKVIAVKKVDNLWGDAIDQFDQLPEMQREQMKSQILGSRAKSGG